jgi:plastocyanin
MRPRYVSLAIALFLLSLFALPDNPVSHFYAATLLSSTISIHLVGQLNGWNGTNPIITVNQGDTVSVILTSGDIDHQFALDRDHDGANPTGFCPSGDSCSRVFNAGAGTTFTFTADLPPGTYAYFCTFHPTMVGSLVVQAVSNPPSVDITKVSPNPASTGTTVTLNFTISSTTTVSGISIDWGDGTITHPSPKATSDTHSYLTTGNSQSQAFTINVTATNGAGHGSVTVSETVTDRPPTLTITSVSPTPANTNQTVTISFTASDPDGTLSSLTVNWGDGSRSDILPASAGSDTHSYNTTGTFTITVIATDNSGSASHASSQPLTVTAPPSPGNHHHHNHHHHDDDHDHHSNDSTAHEDERADAERSPAQSENRAE